MGNLGRVRVLPRLLLIALFASCTDEFIPTGLYDYQVSRLLSGDSAKLWTVNSFLSSGTAISLEDCEDSLFILFEHVDDSLLVSSLSRDCLTASEFDTTEIGMSLPSSNGIIFSDSLLFSTGNHWIVEDLSSQQGKVIFDQDGGVVVYAISSN